MLGEPRTKTENKGQEAGTKSGWQWGKRPRWTPEQKQVRKEEERSILIFYPSLLYLNLLLEYKYCFQTTWNFILGTRSSFWKVHKPSDLGLLTRLELFAFAFVFFLAKKNPTIGKSKNYLLTINQRAGVNFLFIKPPCIHSCFECMSKEEEKTAVPFGSPCLPCLASHTCVCWI